MPFDVNDPFGQKAGRARIRGALDRAQQPSDDNVWKARIVGGLAGAGRAAYDLLAGGEEDVADPLSFGMAPGAMVGQVGLKAAGEGAVALGKKALPVIADEAYGAVKGLKGLYSRLTDTIAKLPEQVMPAKVMSAAKSGTSAEEISTRKLAEFLSGHNPSKPIARADVMAHLDANPIELEVKKLTPQGAKQRHGMDVLRDEFDARYGERWGLDGHQLDPADQARWEAAHDEPMFGRPGSDVKYREYQVPGGVPDSYQETLIKAPIKDNAKVKDLEAQVAARREEVQQLLNQSYNAGWGGDTANAHRLRQAAIDIEKIEISSLNRQMEGARTRSAFESAHWAEDPNVIVHSRANDRFPDSRPIAPDDVVDLSKAHKVYPDDPTDNQWIFPRRDGSGGWAGFGSSIEEATDEMWQSYKSLGQRRDERVPTGEKIRFVEEDQSDLHQLGKKIGYTPESAQTYNEGLAAKLDELDLEYDQLWDEFRLPDGSQPAIGTPKSNEFAERLNQIDQRRRTIIEESDYLSRYPEGIPDLPFKETYPDLAIKEQLLDAANDPEIAGFGMTGAEIQKLRYPNPKGDAGMDFMYDKKHPNILQRLLAPFGGTVEKRTLPMKGPHYFERRGDKVIAQDTEGVRTQVASMWPKNSGTQTGSIDMKNPVIDQLNKQRTQYTIPGPEYWYASLTPEMKEAIKKIGFPAMLALMAARPNEEQ